MRRTNALRDGAASTEAQDAAGPLKITVEAAGGRRELVRGVGRGAKRWLREFSHLVENTGYRTVAPGGLLGRDSLQKALTPYP